jgi:predicted P-loop ATPase
MAFFDDTMAESSDKDELMKLHQNWAVEWAEFETTLGRKGYSRLKQFMSTRIDTYRPPYGRTANRSRDTPYLSAQQ